MRKTGSTDLDLTQDISLGPAFQVGDSSKLKEADAIFEKEQEYVLQEANQVPQKQSDLYVNSDGYAILYIYMPNQKSNLWFLDTLHRRGQIRVLRFIGLFRG